MGRILVPAEIKLNAELLRSHLEVVGEQYKNVQERIHEYYDDDELDTKSWNESKNKMEICYLIISIGITAAVEGITDDIDSLLGCIGTRIWMRMN